MELYLRASGRMASVSDAIEALKVGGYPKLGENPYKQVITVGSNGERFWRHGRGWDAVIGLKGRHEAREAPWLISKIVRTKKSSKQN